MGIEIARELAIAGIDKYPYFTDSLNPTKVIQAMLEVHRNGFVPPDPASTKILIESAVICGAGFLVVGGVVGYYLYLRNSASRPKTTRSTGALNEMSSQKVKGRRPIDNCSPRRPEPKPLPQHPEVEKFVGQGQTWSSDMDLLNNVAGVSDKVIDGTCKDVNF